MADVKVTWLPPTGTLPVTFNRPVAETEANSLIVLGSDSSEVMDIRLQVIAENASNTLLIHYRPAASAVPSTITFKEGTSANETDEIELLADGEKIVHPIVKDSTGAAIPGAKVKWNLERKEQKKFVAPGAINEQDNSIALYGRASADKPPDAINLIATSGSALGILAIKYKPLASAKISELKLTPAEIEIAPKGTQTFTAIPKDASGGKITTEIADADKAFISIDGPDGDNKFTIRGLNGNPNVTLPHTIRVTVKNSVSQNILIVRFAARILVSWTVLPPKIVGDNYGRTVKDDYYCIEVAVDNQSGTDIALAGFAFNILDSDGSLLGGLPQNSTLYSTVHGSLARRKLTHPRTLTLAIISSVGQLMTGFNPFFHNAVHGRNYSNVIDIISNPLEKGTAVVWPDSYPLELAQLESDVMHDDKIVRHNQVVRTKIFFPKRSLFPKAKDKAKRDDLQGVRKALNELVVMGYELGPRLTTTSTKSATEPDGKTKKTP